MDPRNVCRRSFTADYLQWIAFCTLFTTDRFPWMMRLLHRLLGRAGWPHLGSVPFSANLPPRMGVFQVLRAIFEKWKSSSTL